MSIAYVVRLKGLIPLMVTEHFISHQPSSEPSQFPLIAGDTPESSRLQDQAAALDGDPQLRASTAKVETKWLTQPPRFAVGGRKVVGAGPPEMLIILRDCYLQVAEDPFVLKKKNKTKQKPFPVIFYQ